MNGFVNRPHIEWTEFYVWGNILVTQKAMNLAGFVFGAPWFLMVGGFKQTGLAFVLDIFFIITSDIHFQIIPKFSQYRFFLLGGGLKKNNTSQILPKGDFIGFFLKMVRFFRGSFFHRGDFVEVKLKYHRSEPWLLEGHFEASDGGSGKMTLVHEELKAAVEMGT